MYYNESRYYQHSWIVKSRWCCFQKLIVEGCAKFPIKYSENCLGTWRRWTSVIRVIHLCRIKISQFYWINASFYRWQTSPAWNSWRFCYNLEHEHVKKFSGGGGGAREPWEKWSGKVGWHKVGEQKQRKGRRSNAREVQTLSNFKSTECLICNKEGKKCLSLHLTPGGGFWQPHLRFGCMCQTQDKEGRQEVCWISGSSAFLEFSPTSEQLRGITH